MNTKPTDARYPQLVEESLFNGLIPDNMTAQYIERLVNQGYTLVRVLRANDHTALDVHAQLEKKHSKIFHYMLSAYEDLGKLGWNTIGINLYFTYPKP